ncbi:hypothetical protein FRC00_007063 [Tulasnella sp. 408]|nr:hypothetical protein FRC00_007063 [Tulasnella sp. 408]
MTISPAQNGPLKIAFTFDRRSQYLSQGVAYEDCAQFETDEVIDLMAKAIERQGHQVDMVGNLRDVVKCLAQDPLPDWDLVFNYSEGHGGCASMREARMPALLEAYGYECVFADSAGLAKGHDKALTKMVLEHYSVPTPPSAIVPPLRVTGPEKDLTPARSAITSSRHASSLAVYPLFAKPTSECCSVGITKITSPHDLEPAVAALRQRYPDQEILLEPFLSGREFTIALVGTGDDARVLGVQEIVFPQDKEDNFCSFNWKMFESAKSVEYPDVKNPEPAVAKSCEAALRAWKAIGCRDLGRVDVRMDEANENAYVLEDWLSIAPVGGLNLAKVEAMGAWLFTIKQPQKLGADKRVNNR